jgi:tetratricopeptide (TPR) repeat protein
MGLVWATAFAQPVSKDEQRDLARAEALMAQGAEQDAFVSFKDFLRRYPGSPLGPKAQLHLGDLHLRRSEFQLAQETFRRVHTMPQVQLQDRLRAALGTGDAWRGLGRLEDAILEWQAVRRRSGKNPDLAEAARIRILAIDPYAKVTDPVLGGGLE